MSRLGVVHSANEMHYASRSEQREPNPVIPLVPFQEFDFSLEP